MSPLIRVLKYLMRAMASIIITTVPYAYFFRLVLLPLQPLRDYGVRSTLPSYNCPSVRPSAEQAATSDVDAVDGAPRLVE